MAIDPNQLKNKAMGAMNGFSAGQRVVVGIAALTLVIGGVLFAQWASKPTMVPLFSNVSSEDAAEITGKLSSSNTPYELADGGATILVPKEKVYQTRIDLAGQGLPSGGSVGYKLLDKQGITTSDFLQHVGYQRALEGELSNTIGSIQGIQSATVHLVIPKQDVFANDSKKPTASVLVTLQNGKQLSNNQVQSIVNLVASGVEGLTSDNVTVSDDKGRLLAAPGQGTTGTEDQDGDRATAMENSITTKIQNLLTPVVGAGKAVVATRAELNWDKKEEVAEIYNPLGKEQQPTATRSLTETYGNGAGGEANGCLGVGNPTNGVCLPANGEEGANNGYSKVEQSQDNALDKTITKTVTQPGDIERLSVAVMYDSTVAGVDQAQIEALVTQAAGLQPARGDSVTVGPMPFDKTAAEEAEKAAKAAADAAASEQTMNMIKTGGTILMVLIALGVLMFLTKKRGAQFQSATPIPMNEIDALMPALPSGQVEQPELEQSPDSIERAKVDKDITMLIEKQPDEVASLLRSWLADRRS